MKKTLTIVTMMALTLAFGTAFAGNDDIPYMTNENEAVAVLGAKDFSSIEPRVAEVSSDDIPAFYQKAMLRHETILAGRVASGEAAGGGGLEEAAAEHTDLDAFGKLISPARESDQLPVL